ncbi:MAG: hypothetical protein KTR25_14325 [Myxococcales bacterium]|nr:hypothetical protein [Myxococcales bacterium]
MKGKKPTSARKIRSDHGTRVARKITCTSCGSLDTIHFSPRPNQPALCRNCAAKQLGVVDREANIGTEQRQKCTRCELFLTKICHYDDPLDCVEYARALAMRQGNRLKSASRSKNGVVLVRRQQ